MSTEKRRAHSCHEVAVLLGICTPWTPRTMGAAREELQAFFDEHGRRPSANHLHTLDAWLRDHGSSLRKLCDEMGLPGGARLDRTMESVRQEVQAFFDEHGRRPTQRDLRNTNAWLYARGSSLRKQCDEMGLPGGARLDRTMESVRQELQAFYNEHGRRPVGREMTGVESWLRDHDSSIRKLCDEMGLPGGARRSRTMGEARQEVQAFFDEHGRRPTQIEMTGVDSWLYARGSSLRKLCDEMGLPGGARLDRTMENVRQELQAFYNEHGRRPKTHEKSALQGWLQLRGASVSRMCDEMGFPGGVRRSRTMESARQEVQVFFDEHGRRPKTADVYRLHQWLHRRGVSLAVFCDEVGLPDDLTMEKVRRELQRFFEKHGRRPSSYSCPDFDGWLRRHHGSSVRMLCDEMSLPGGLRLDRTMESVSQEIQGFFDEHGVRPPSDKRTQGVDSWLRRRGSSVRKICDQLGLPGGAPPVVRGRTMKTVRQEIRKFVEEHGRRPRVKDKKAVASWLRKRGVVLRDLCREMGIE